MNFKNIKVRTKLSFLIGVAVVGLLVFGVVAFSTLNTVEVNGEMYKSIALTTRCTRMIHRPHLSGTSSPYGEPDADRERSLGY